MTTCEMIEIAKKLANRRFVSPFMEVGGVVCVIETKSGNVYSGINIDTDCGIGMCAERNTCGTMLTNGETEIVKMICYKNGELILPCGVCREFLLQLNENNKDMKIMQDGGEDNFVTLSSLMPLWWGTQKYQKGKPTKNWN